MPPIPAPEENEGGKIIPQNVAELPLQEAPEVLPYNISFASYNHKECEIDGLKKPNAATALKIIRDVGTSFVGEHSIQSRFIDDVKHIARTQAYKDIYKSLGPDIELKEIKYKRESKDFDKKVDLRIFFYTIEKERLFYVIAIRQTHYNLDHS